MTFTKLLLVEGTNKSLKEARTRLVEVDKDMRRINRKCVSIDMLAQSALVCSKLAKERDALEKLQAALELAESGGWFRNFVDPGDP